LLSDKLIAAKSGYLNFPFGSLELLYFGGLNYYRFKSVQNDLAQDESNDNSFYKRILN
jgi:hypothetical protein